MFLSNNNQNLWTNFFTFAISDKNEIKHKVFSTKIFLTAKFNQFSYFSINLKTESKNIFLNWIIDMKVIKHPLFENRVCNCLKSEKKILNDITIRKKNKTRKTIGNFQKFYFLCSLAKLIFFTNFIQKEKINVIKKGDKNSFAFYRMFCVNNTTFVNRLMQKIPNSKLIGKLESMGAIKFSNFFFKEKSEIFLQSKNFNLYSKNLDFFFQFSKFMFFQQSNLT